MQTVRSCSTDGCEQVYSYHLQYAFHNCPVAEMINLSPGADKVTAV